VICDVSVERTANRRAGSARGGVHHQRISPRPYRGTLR
jgi:hypothetical protein